MKIFHHFHEGRYVKESHLSAGESGEKHIHPYSHKSRLVFGTARLWVDETSQTLNAPIEVVIEAGKRHRVIAVTDIVWECEHETNCTDPLLVDEEILKKVEA